MKLSDIDKNFDLIEDVDLSNNVFYQIPDSNFDLYGVYYDQTEEMFRRVPKSVSKTVSEGVDYLSGYTAGGRIRFKTNAKEIVICAEYLEGIEPRNNWGGIGASAFVLSEDRCDGSKYTHLVTILPLDGKKTINSRCEIDGDKERSYTLYMPNYNGVKKLLIGVNKGAKINKGKSYKSIAPILYYGSSITQGGCASTADASYQSIISKWNNVDFINLGFSGCAKGEDAIIQYLCEIKCSLFVCDYDHNQWDMDLFKSSYLKMYQNFRSTHPTVPILFISAPDFDINPKLRSVKEKIIRKYYLDAKKAGDNNVYFYAGRKLFGKHDREICTVDRVHPNTLGMYRMAQKIYGVMKKISKDFEG